MIPAEAVEAAARGMAILDDHDGCFLEVDAWNAQEEWERDAFPDNYPGSAIEDCAYWRAKATAALEAAAPHMARIITTTEELDVLPFESVIRDAEGHVLERWGHDPANVWVTMMVNTFIPRGDIALPATVIYRPTT